MVTAPKVGEHLIVDVHEKEKVLVVTLNRPKQLNAMTDQLQADLNKTFDWFESTPELWVLILTGAGRAFCCGQDLENWLASELNPVSGQPRGADKILANKNGFAGVARRRWTKPVIAALNGHALGGGAEIVANCDVVIGVEGGMIGFPEVRRGVVASVGGIPFLTRKAPILTPYLLTGEPIPAHLLKQHLLHDLVKPDQVLPTAWKWARRIVECSPDAVATTKEQINLTLLDGLGAREVVERSAKDPDSVKTYDGENQAEGLKAFTEKRDPVWKNPFVRKAKL